MGKGRIYASGAAECSIDRLGGNTAGSRQGGYSALAVTVSAQMRRGEYFSALFAIACVNGLASRAIQSVNRLGLLDACFGTFGLSAIVLGSIVAGIALVFRDQTIGVRPSEIALGTVIVFFSMLPIGALGWVGVTALSAYLIAYGRRGEVRRGATILLAVTAPMLWSRVLFKLFADQILKVDASFVSWLLGTPRSGNLVEFADGSAQLVILPACSSLANVSLALLCWISFSELARHRKSLYDCLWCSLACASVILVNVTRMALSGLSQWHYDTLHSFWGDAFGNMTMSGLVLSISALGVRRELRGKI